MDLDGLGIQLEAFLLVDEEFLNIFALIPLELDHLSHLGVVDDGAIAGCRDVSGWLTVGRKENIPNFFLMTLRIFFWSNFLGRPWTVVRVLRPLRSAKEVSIGREMTLPMQRCDDPGHHQTISREDAR